MGGRARARAASSGAVTGSAEQQRRGGQRRTTPRTTTGEAQQQDALADLLAERRAELAADPGAEPGAGVGDRAATAAARCAGARCRCCPSRPCLLGTSCACPGSRTGGACWRCSCVGVVRVRGAGSAVRRPWGQVPARSRRLAPGKVRQEAGSGRRPRPAGGRGQPGRSSSAKSGSLRGLVRRPGRGVPDLEPGVGADDDAVALESGVRPQRRRDGDAALPVRDVVGGAAEELRGSACACASCPPGWPRRSRRAAAPRPGRANSAAGNTERQRSWPLVITTPPATSSRYLAGRNSRPFSSSRGVWVPRNTAPPPRPGSTPVLPDAPRYSTSLPRQRRRDLRRPCPCRSRPVCSYGLVCRSLPQRARLVGTLRGRVALGAVTQRDRSATEHPGRLARPHRSAPPLGSARPPHGVPAAATGWDDGRDRGPALEQDARDPAAPAGGPRGTAPHQQRGAGSAPTSTCSRSRRGGSATTSSRSSRASPTSCGWPWSCCSPRATCSSRTCPGVGKTMLAKALARSIDCTVRRVQFTPDLLPSDVTGVSVFDQVRREFEFKPGAVFANIVVGDEINRASPKTQSALLEAMEERQVTVDGTTYVLERPFMVVATQNPIEMEGTYPLPEAQRDRFTARRLDGLPLPGRGARHARHARPRRPARRPRAGRRRRGGAQAHRGRAVGARRGRGASRYVVDLVTATRTSPDLRLGASPRSTLQLLRAARAQAALDGRDYVLPDDVQSLAGAGARPPPAAHGRGAGRPAHAGGRRGRPRAPHPGTCGTPVSGPAGGACTG